MTIQMRFKNLASSDSIKQYAKEKSENFKKYFRGRVSITWNFSIEKTQSIAHCHVVGNHIDVSGETSAESLRAAIDLTLEKVEKQIRKHKEIVKDHLHKTGHRVPAAS